jgi:hypothetical protein
MNAIRHLWLWSLYIISIIATLSNGCSKRTNDIQIDTWVIRPPSTYRHVKQPEQDRVFQWLQGEPIQNPRPWMEVIPSPYTFDEWVDRGRKIDHGEDILIDCYNHYTGEIRLASIIFGLQKIGTFRSVPTLLQIVADPDIDENERSLGVSALGSIGDPSVVGALINIAKAIDTQTNDSKELRIFHTDVICALCNIGDPRAIPVVEEYRITIQLSDNMHEFFGKQIDFLKQNQKHFVQDWILRLHLNNKDRNSKGLPYYLSKKKWAIAGKDIPGISQILFELYHVKEKRVSNNSILDAIGAVGSESDIQPLLDIILKDSKIKSEEVDTAFRSILDIGGEQIRKEIITKLDGYDFADKQVEERIKSSIKNVFWGPSEMLDSMMKNRESFNPIPIKEREK